MATIHPLSAAKREEAGTKFAKKLRREGRVPGVIYGGKQDNYGVSLASKEITDLLAASASENILVRLDIDGAKEQGKLALIQDVQHHSLTRAINHVDFRAVSEDEEILASVPLVLVGDCVGVQLGGLLDQQLKALDVRCVPGKLPDKVEGDITNVGVSETLTVGEVAWPEGVTPVAADSVVVALVAELRAHRTSAEDEEAAATVEAQEEAPAAS